MFRGFVGVFGLAFGDANVGIELGRFFVGKIGIERADENMAGVGVVIDDDNFLA